MTTAELEEIGSGDRLSFTMFLAAAFHALLIFGVSFGLEKGAKIAPTLNITLATHQSHIEPEKADFLAQHNQLASGTEEKISELTTRKLAEIDDIALRKVSPIPEQEASVASEINTQVISSQQKNTLKALKQEDPKDKLRKEERQGERENRFMDNPEFASLRAKLDKLQEDLAKQPRIRRLTSVSTKASYDAAYLNTWTQKIEQVGNENFPKKALKKGIFGNLRLSVMLNPNGTVDKVEILQSSGQKILDNAAIQIVRLSAPFQPFPPEIRKNTDKLEIIRTWRFEITGLSTRG